MQQFLSWNIIKSIKKKMTIASMINAKLYIFKIGKLFFYQLTMKS